MAKYSVRSAVICALACIAAHQAIAAELPRDGVFVYSTLCIEKESGDAAGYRIRLVRSERGDSLYFEWSEGPRYGPALASKLAMDPNTSKITFTIPANAPPNYLTGSQTYSGEISAGAVVLDQGAVNGILRAIHPIVIPRVVSYSDKIEQCK